MAVATSFASKVDSTNRTGDMILTAELVDQEPHFILKVHVASATVLMLSATFLVSLHFLDRPEETRAVVKGTGHVPLRRHFADAIWD